MREEDFSTSVAGLTMTSSLIPPTFIPSYHDEDSVKSLEYRQLGKTDMTVSALSFGASSLGGVFRVTDDAESGEQLVKILI